MTDLKVGDNVCMSAFHWVFKIVAIDGDMAQLQTPYLDLAWFPLNVMGRTSEEFEDRSTGWTNIK